MTFYNEYFTNFENFIMKTQLLEYPEEIQDKVSYLLQDGKRLRPILCLLFSGQTNNSMNSMNSMNINEKDKIIYSIASSIETIHCLSLVLDDMPDMDNDNLRRDKQSFHSKYGVEYTNFFIYYIFNHIFNQFGLFISNILDTDSNNIIEITDYIRNTFYNYLNILIDGQYCDLQWNMDNSLENNIISNNEFIKEKDIIRELLIDFCDLDNLDDLNDLDDLDDLDDIDIYKIYKNLELNMRKTSSLFNLSISVGFILQIWSKQLDINKFKDLLEQLSIWSNILGYMFQISDDILDIDSDFEKGNPNICQILGKEKTCKLLKKGCQWLKTMIVYIVSIVSIKEDESSIVFNLDVVNEIIEKIVKRIK